MATKRRMHFTRANAQNGARSFLWPEFRKTATIRARYIAGAFTVQTREGALDMPEGGYLALDDEGYPYPIQKDVFERIYEQVAEGSITQPFPFNYGDAPPASRELDQTKEANDG